MKEMLSLHFVFIRYITKEYQFTQYYFLLILNIYECKIIARYIIIEILGLMYNCIEFSLAFLDIFKRLGVSFFYTVNKNLYNFVLHVLFLIIKKKVYFLKLNV